MFDSVFAKCPYCRELIEFQSKAGDCTLNKYRYTSVVPEIAADLVSVNADGIPYNIVECCNRSFILTANIPRVRMDLVEWFEDDEEQEWD